MEKLPAAAYSFPCGFHKEFLAERAKIPESLVGLQYVVGEVMGRESLLNVSQIAATSCGMCDVDLRPVSFSKEVMRKCKSVLVAYK
jgi:predicted RNA-binding protein with EMAP domain